MNKWKKINIYELRNLDTSKIENIFDLFNQSNKNVFNEYESINSDK